MEILPALKKLGRMLLRITCKSSFCDFTGTSYQGKLYLQQFCMSMIIELSATIKIVISHLVVYLLAVIYQFLALQIIAE